MQSQAKSYSLKMGDIVKFGPLHGFIVQIIPLSIRPYLVKFDDNTSSYCCSEDLELVHPLKSQPITDSLDAMNYTLAGIKFDKPIFDEWVKKSFIYKDSTIAVKLPDSDLPDCNCSVMSHDIMFSTLHLPSCPRHKSGKQ